MTLSEAVVEQDTIQGLPRIDRFFPECWCATVEAVAKFQFGISDFGKLYGRHTFHYAKPPGPIAYRSNDVELDLWIHREELPQAELEALMATIYGVRARTLRFECFASFWEYCSDKVKSGVPVVTSFDLRFIKARREYGKVYSPHVIAIYGYRAREQIVVAAEQMIGTIGVDMHDFRRCFEHRLAADGGVVLWELSRAPQPERSLERGEVVARIRANIENLTSSEPGLGFGALAHFRTDLSAYLESGSFGGKPFSLPGFWVFSHERHVERNWLKAVRHLCADEDSPLLGDFDALLLGLFKRWLNADYLVEKCLASGNGKALTSLPSYLNQIFEEEKRALNKWSELLAQVTRGL